MTLVVTAADLRVAQGYVRCGRCSSVFNALAQLTEDGQGAAGVAPESPPAPAAPPADPDERPPAPAAPDDESIPEAALEFDPETTDAASVFVQPPPDPQWTAATGSFRAMVAADQEPQPEAADQQVDVEIDAALLSDIVRGDPLTPAPAAAAVTPAPAEPRPARAHAPTAGSTARQAQPAARAPLTRTPPTAPATPQPHHLDGDDHGTGTAVPDAPPHIPPRREPLLWTLGAALLVLALIAQFINHHRDALATNPRLTRPLAALYGAFGVALAPQWDLHAYDVRQLGATVEPGSTG
ncbi:MAG: MJ0042-type zinc finger domain-containing protein, partial [Steroidobacteraceae bacterium]